MKSTILFLISLFAVCLAYGAFTVTKVSDGDTVWVKDDAGSKIKVRLNKIDAPESDQPFGKESTRRLSDLVYQKQVELKSDGKDRYDRLLAEIYLNGTNLNLLLVKDGCAMVYYSCKDEKYRAAESAAKEKKLGLWKDGSAVNPYEWRKMKRGVR